MADNYEFAYAMGTLNNILDGDVERVENMDELPKSRKQKILVPRLLGVYQQLHDKQEQETDNILIELIRSVSSVYGKQQDNTHPELICIGYNPNVTPLNLLNHYMKRDTNLRLKRVPWTDIMTIDFDDKPTYHETLKQIYHAVYCDNKEDSKEIIQEAVQLLRNTRADFGLSALESMILNAGIVRLKELNH